MKGEKTSFLKSRIYLFALSTASSSVLNLCMDWTGPNISSWQIFISSSTSPNIVGSTKYPCSPCLNETVMYQTKKEYVSFISASYIYQHSVATKLRINKDALIMGSGKYIHCIFINRIKVFPHLLPPVRSFAPSFSPVLMYPNIFSICSRSIWGPWSVSA